MSREITLTGKQFMALMLFLLTFCYILLGMLLTQNIPHPVSTSQSQFPLPDSPENEHIRKLKSWPIPGNSSKHLHVYVQLSDLHISAIWDKNRVSDLIEFCHRTLDLIKPEVVLVTGDITDAKLENYEGSHQSLLEWQQYMRVLHQSGVLNKTVWLDIRGNHDAFDVPSLESSENYYKSYSIRGKHGQLSYHYKHLTEVDGDEVSFIGMDACLDPGPKRPFNFFGVLSQSESDKIANFSADAANSSKTTIYFGHYPTSVIAHPSSSYVRNLIRSGIIYLCGHLHTLANMLPHMYAHQDEGFLELELGDWKDNRLYRILVLDHGLLSFIDIPTHHYPVVIVTNPKNDKFLVDTKEPIQNIELSTHIRVLAFSNEPITRVDIYINGEFQGRAKHVEGLLYVLAWNTDIYKTEQHVIKAVAVDGEEREVMTEHSFSLDGSRTPLSFLQRFVIHNDHTIKFKYIFGVLYLSSTIPLILFKVFNIHLLMMTESRMGCFMLRFTQKWIRRFCCLGNTSTIFYPILFYQIYMLVGPWFVGYILSDHLGACFVWGLWVKGHVLPTSLTYLYASMHILTFNLPLTFYLATQIDKNIAKVRNNINDNTELKRHAGWMCRMKARKHLQRWILRPGKHFSKHFIFFFIVIFQAYLAFSGFLKSYGLLAFLLCPIRTWSILLALYLHYRLTKPPPPHSPANTSPFCEVIEDDDVMMKRVGGVSERLMRSEDDDDDDDDDDDGGDDDDDDDVYRRHNAGDVVSGKKHVKGYDGDDDDDDECDDDGGGVNKDDNIIL